MKQTATVRAIIKKGQKILLVRRAASGGEYELPGGKPEPGEAPEAAVVRHVRKDIGLEPSVAQLQSVVAYAHPNQPDDRHEIMVFAVGIDPDARIAPGDEHDKFAWAELSDAQQYALTETARAALNIGTPPAATDEAAQLQPKDEAKKATPLRATADVFVYSDGGSRGNPGPSAAGFVILDDQQALLFESGTYLGITTNNQAEYQAVKLALQKALQLGARRVRVSVDSLLVANQMNGLYQIKNRDLWPIHAAIKELTGKFQKVTFSHVPREQNTEADAMVNKVLDEYARPDVPWPEPGAS